MLVLQQRLNVLCITGWRGQRAASRSVCNGGAAGLAGRAGLDLNQRVVRGDEDGNNKSACNSARPEKERRTRDGRLLCVLCGSSCHRLHVSQLHVEEEEDEAVESWTQTVAQTSDTCDYPLNHTLLVR